LTTVYNVLIGLFITTGFHVLIGFCLCVCR